MITEEALREQEDTTKVSFDFLTQVILNILLRKPAMVTINLHCRPISTAKRFYRNNPSVLQRNEAYLTPALTSSISFKVLIGNLIFSVSLIMTLVNRNGADGGSKGESFLPPRRYISRDTTAKRIIPKDDCLHT